MVLAHVGKVPRVVNCAAGTLPLEHDRVVDTVICRVLEFTHSWADNRDDRTRRISPLLHLFFLLVVTRVFDFVWHTITLLVAPWAGAFSNMENPQNMVSKRPKNQARLLEEIDWLEGRALLTLLTLRLNG